MKTEKSSIRSKAVFSDDGKHRLLLQKEWVKDKPTAMIIMINPNTADTLTMDLTTMLTINNLNTGFRQCQYCEPVQQNHGQAEPAVLFG